MSDKIAFLFPGQGAQSVGMCKTLYEQHGIFRDCVEEAEDLLYRKIWPLVLEGPERELKKTVHAQISLFVLSIATMRTVLFEKPHLQPTFCAGLSLGEYTALVAAGILRFSEAAQLVEQRALLMSQACETHPGKMMAVIGLTLSAIESVIANYKGDGVLAVANYNSEQQIVVSGSAQAISWFESEARLAGARRLIELDVEGAFHSPLMQSAADQLKPLVETAKLQFSPIKACSNVLGDVVDYSEDFRELLVKQVTHPVLWVPTIQSLEAKGVTTFIEIGPGRVLYGLNRRITTMSKSYSVETVEDIAALP